MELYGISEEGDSLSDGKRAVSVPKLYRRGRRGEEAVFLGKVLEYSLDEEGQGRTVRDGDGGTETETEHPAGRTRVLPAG